MLRGTMLVAALLAVNIFGYVAWCRLIDIQDQQRTGLLYALLNMLVIVCPIANAWASAKLLNYLVRIP